MQRTALITGASRGLGLALAQALARDGWTLLIDSRGEAALHGAANELSKLTTVVAVTGDITDATHRQQLAEAAARLGGLDAVVNNASILGPSPQPNLLDYPLDVLTQVYQTNVIAPLALLQAVKAHLKPNARIINVSSDAGVEPYGGWGGYGSSKAGLEQLSAILAVENPGYKVYWVDPGDMRTQMHQEAFPGEDISDRPLPEASVPGFLALLNGDLPSGRYKARDILQKPANTGASVLQLAVLADDYQGARRLYEQGLGLRVIEEWDKADGRGVLLESGRGVLELLDAKQVAAVDRIEAGGEASGAVRLVFQVENVEATGTSMSQHGAAIVRQPVDTPWGHHNQRLRAPDGLHITLFTPIESKPEAETSS
ncbi:MAG: SDR family NAD(P)-dependent oxidoreductase [Anaerolineae bacterium]